jgi:hypothetical protein
MQKRDYTAQQRREMAAKGEAFPDGSYPIANEADLKAAMQSVGRASNVGRAKRHIKRRAKALGLMDLLTPAFGGAQMAKGYYDETGFPWHVAYDPPDLPIPCTPADLTPTMAAGMPTELQAEFCEKWNLLTMPSPNGLNMCDDRAYFMALDLCCEMGGWIRLADGSYGRFKFDGADWVNEDMAEDGGEVEKVGRMLSAANRATLQTAYDALSALLADSEPAAEGEMGKRIGFEVTITKTDADLQQCFGYAYVAKNADGTAVVDHSGDVVDVASLKKAIYAGFGKVKSREMHEKDAEATLIASAWIDHETLTKMGGSPANAPDGAWWVGVQVNDAALWKRIKAGEVSAFSIGGSGTRTPV